jgi:hypothetical protein
MMRIRARRCRRVRRGPRRRWRIQLGHQAQQRALAAAAAADDGDELAGAMSRSMSCSTVRPLKALDTARSLRPTPAAAVLVFLGVIAHDGFWCIGGAGHW